MEKNIWETYSNYTTPELGNSAAKTSQLSVRCFPVEIHLEIAGRRVVEKLGGAGNSPDDGRTVSERVENLN